MCDEGLGRRRWVVTETGRERGEPVADAEWEVHGTGAARRAGCRLPHGTNGALLNAFQGRISELRKEVAVDQGYYCDWPWPIFSFPDALLCLIRRELIRAVVGNLSTGAVASTQRYCDKCSLDTCCEKRTGMGNLFVWMLARRGFRCMRSWALRRRVRSRLVWVCMGEVAFIDILV
jgi:hypothetical protein